MLNLYERNFAMAEKITDDSGILNRSLDRNSALVFDALTQERAAAENKDGGGGGNKYKDYELQFGGSWTDTKWPDSVTISRNGEEVKTVAIPLIYKYDKTDILDIPFILDDVPYFLHFDNDNDNKIMKPTKLHIPENDTNEYTIAVSTQTLPWFLINDQNTLYVSDVVTDNDYKYFVIVKKKDGTCQFIRFTAQVKFGYQNYLGKEYLRTNINYKNTDFSNLSECIDGVKKSIETSPFTGICQIELTNSDIIVCNFNVYGDDRLYYVSHSMIGGQPSNTLDRPS